MKQKLQSFCLYCQRTLPVLAPDSGHAPDCAIRKMGERRRENWKDLQIALTTLLMAGKLKTASYEGDRINLEFTGGQNFEMILLTATQRNGARKAAK